jgi:hypothetical protein
MMKRIGTMLFVVITVVLFLNIAVSHPTKACKDIVAVGDATAGDYNLLLKVRDPSRPGLQVLCIVPEGYTYTYHHPWTGKPLDFTVNHKFIGVATKGDTIPDIVKAGMALSDVGIAYGDADTGSNWKNPTRHAWDDFDWIRYACQEADTEDEAVTLMTKDLVDQMHATAVSENLFIVGPNKGVIVEADAFHYDIQEIDGILVMSNYPKELWGTQLHKKAPIASSFDIEKEAYVGKGRTLRLNSLFGVKIVDIGEDWVVARQVPFLKISNKWIRFMGERITIHLGERKTVGDYSVRLLDINRNKAKISVSYMFKAWEDQMLEYIQPHYGRITVKDMMNWSRLHGEDLEGLRPMCEDFFEYEAVAIYKIPNENYETLSSGWFSPNHACSSIYVPFHICDTEIFTPYTTGEAATLSLELLHAYGHDVLTDYFSNAEDVFLYENEFVENVASRLMAERVDVSEFFTVVDMGMQRQAWLTEEVWMDVSELSNQQHKDEVVSIIVGLWKHNYSTSLKSMKTAIQELKEISRSTEFIGDIEEISLSVCKSRIDALRAIGRRSSIAEREYATGSKFMRQGEHELGFDHLEKAFAECETSINRQPHSTVEPVESEGEERIDVWSYVLIICLAIALFTLLSKLRWKPE